MTRSLRVSLAIPILPAMLLMLLAVILLTDVGLAQEEGEPSPPAPSGLYPASIALQPDAQNIQLVAQLGGAVLRTAVAGPYAYVGMGPRLVVLNVSNPNNPTFVGWSDVLPGIVQDVAVVGNYVYVIGNEYRARLWIFSVADPARPTVVNTVDFQAGAQRIAIAGNRAYVTVSGKGLLILDISNPASPQLLGQFPAGGALIAVAGNYAYTISGVHFYVVDVSNPITPTRVGTYTLPEGTQVFGLAADGHRAAIAAGRRGVLIIDVSNPFSPNQVGAYDTPNETHDVAISGNLIHVADTSALRILDISTPSSPREIGFCNLPWGLARAVTLAGNHAYIANDTGGLRIVRIANPDNPTEAARFFIMEYATGVARTGHYLYVSQGLSDTRIVQVTDPSRPTPVGTYPGSPHKAILVKGNRLYIGTNRLSILDVSDPARPVLLGQSQTLTNYVTSIAVAGNYAYGILRYTGMCILDVSNLSSPARKGCYPNMSAKTVAVDSTYAYVGDNSYLSVLDVSNPDAPVLRSRYGPIYETIQDIAVSGEYLYTAGMYRFTVFRRQDPYTPTLISTYSLPGSGDALVLRGNLAYIANNHKGVRVLDVSDPARPVELGYYDTPGLTFHLDVEGDFIYAADFDGGLLVLRFTPPLTAIIPPTGGSLTSPRDRTTLTFPPNAFTTTVVLTYTTRAAQDVPSPGHLVGIGHFFEVTAVYSATGQPARLAPGATFTITVGYTDEERGPAVEDTLALYWWENGQWQREETSQVNPAQNTVIARPDHFSLWGVLGQTRRVYLPAVLRNR